MSLLHKLYLVDGLPGIGKTTCAFHLKEAFEKEGHQVKLYPEGSSHPADLAWNAYLSLAEYFDFLEAACALLKLTTTTIDQEELLELIKCQTRLEDNHAIIAYTQIEFPNDSFSSLVEDLAAREVYDGRVTLSEFKSLHLRRWRNFAKHALNSTNTIFIFECSYLQNIIFELMGFYDLPEQEILSYLQQIMDTVLCLNPTILYLEADSLDKLIEITAQKRPASETSPGWLSQMIQYVEKTNYGKLHKLKGKVGLRQFLQRRYELDQLALSSLSIPIIRKKRIL